MKLSELIEKMITLADDLAHEGDGEYESANTAFTNASRGGKNDVARARVIDMAEANGKIKASNRFRTELYALRAAVKDEPETVPPKAPTTP